ncbi:MAG: GNAT family N-acetyltransferase [Mesorhizobium sp.]|nr:GNAT family N-acetyltransferase [Mesorhizobium sp.]
MRQASIQTPAGPVQLRTERDADRDFRYRLFYDSRPPEWDHVRSDPVFFERLMQHQFAAQTTGYRNQCPNADFDIIELGGQPIGRLVVERLPDLMHVVDIAIVPSRRNRGIGGAILRHLLAEAGATRCPVRLYVSSDNDPSLRLYLRLGFVPVDGVPGYVALEWTIGPPA